MQLGTGLFTAQAHPDDDRLPTERYAEILRLTREIEAAGLDSAWTSEHYFESDEYLSASMPVLGAMAAETESIEIGPCVALGPLYHPIRLAEDAATLDLLSDDRLTLGLAIGSNPREFEAFEIPVEERADRLEDLLPFLRAAWSSGPMEYESFFYDIPPETTIQPKPLRGDIPLVLGGNARPAVRRAARYADGWCAPSSLSIDEITKRVEDIVHVRESESIQGSFTIYLLQHGWVDESKAKAWETMQDGYFYLQRRYAELYSGEPVHQLEGKRKQELKSQAIYGTPDDVRAELERYEQALPTDSGAIDDIHFILRTYYPGVETEEMITCIDRLGRSVAPLIR